MYSKLYGKLRMLARNEMGATAVEYAIMAAMIAVVIFGAVQVLGVSVQTGFMSVISGLE